MTPTRTAPALPWIGTLVTANIDGHRITGEVMPYQHSRYSQVTFPVAFGPRWRTMTTATITELPNQPPGRREPDRIGECAASTPSPLTLPTATTAAFPEREPLAPAQRTDSPTEHRLPAPAPRRLRTHMTKEHP
ncbi:hypothetical protein [Amycolatopsis sp. lyj-112]|uniref:hypothetical protein n=1 Tax=Amycolatopsis sp. lyj-112 TaxID=2789288 RepID=UPI0039787C6D